MAAWVLFLRVRAAVVYRAWGREDLTQMGGKQQVIVLGANRWNFEDEKTGKQVTGAKLTTTNGYPQNDSEERMGCEPLLMRTETEQLDQLKGKLPAICEIDVEMRQVGKNIALIAHDVRIVRSINLRELLTAPAASPVGVPNGRTPVGAS